MGLAWTKTEYEENIDRMTVPQQGVITRPYGYPVEFPFRDITIPRPRLGVLGERLGLLSVRLRLVLACALMFVIAGSFCAVSRLSSDRSRTNLETARMEYRTMEGRLSELDSLGRDVRVLPASLQGGTG